MKPKSGIIVVTGAAGLVGQNLVRLLLDKGYRVIAVDKNKHNLKILRTVNPDAQVVCADVSRKGRWQRVFSGAGAVVQLQAQIAARDASAFVRNNVESVQLVIGTCKKYRVPHLVHLSSSVVISVAKDDYTKTKREGEELVKKSSVQYTMFRPPLLYGCFDAKHLGWITRFLEHWPVFPIPGEGSFVRQPLYVLDLCKVILSAIKKGPSRKVHNIIGHERIPYKHLVRILARERNLTRLFIQLPVPFFGFLMKCYSWISGKIPFTNDQLTALTAGDEFPVENWTEEFDVKYTPFVTAIREVFSSPLYKYRDEMKPPH